MKFYGYSSVDKESLLELSEVTLCSNPKKLKKIAAFLNQCASEMENNSDWEHEHISGESDTDFIIYNENNLPKYIRY